MKKWKLWSGTFLIFLAGICIGAAGAGIYVRHVIEAVIQEGPPAVAKLVTKRLTRELDLSKPQQAAVEKAVRETQDQLHDLRQRHWPEAEKIFTSGIDRMKTELSPEQRNKLDVLYGRLKERWRMKSEKNK